MTTDEPPSDSPMRDPVPMTDAEWEPFARATGIEPPFNSGMSYHIECCLGGDTLCGAPQREGGPMMCRVCRAYEDEDDFCPRSELGCEAVREGRG